MIWDSEEPCYKYECVSGSRIRHRICPLPTCDFVSENFLRFLLWHQINIDPQTFSLLSVSFTGSLT